MFLIHGKWQIKSNSLYIAYSTNTTNDSPHYTFSNDISWSFTENIHYYIIALGEGYYKLTYEMNDSIAETPLFYHTDFQVELPIPIKHKYKFIGWTGSNGSVPQTTVLIPQNSVGNKHFVANFENSPFLTEIYTVDMGNTSAAIKVDGNDSYSDTEIVYTSVNNNAREFPDFSISYGPDWKVTAKSDNVYYSESQIKPISEWEKLDTLSWNFKQNVQYYFIVK